MAPDGPSDPDCTLALVDSPDGPGALARVLRPGLVSDLLARSEALPCEADGCARKTREGKPRCTEHVLQMPYVQGVLARIAAREQEVELARHARAARAGGAPPLTQDERRRLSHGTIADEVLNILSLRRRGPASRLAVECAVAVVVLEEVASAMRDDGRVALKLEGPGSDRLTVLAA